MSLIMLTSKNTLNSMFYKVISWSFALALAFLIILHIQLTLVDTNNEELGKYRR